MSSWIHDIPNFGIGAMVIAAGLTVTTLVPFLIRKRWGWSPDEHWIKGAEEGFKLFTSLSLMILAFCLVRVQGDHRNIEDLVAREGTIVQKLHRAMGSYEGPEAALMQGQLQAYARQVVDQEWPRLAHGQHDAEVLAVLTRLIKTARSLDADTPVKQLARVEIVAALTQLADVRDARLAASQVQLPGYYYQALIISLLAMAFFGWFQTPLPKMAAYVGGVTLGLGLMVTLLIVTSAHFAGESAIQATPIVRALESMGPR